MHVFEKALSGIEDILHVAGCLALITVAAFINADILMRLILDTPVEIQFELTEIYLMPMLAMLPLARVYRMGGHLALEVIPADAFGRASPAVHRMTLVAAAVFFAAVTWKSGEFALHALMRGDVEWGAVDWPLGWAYAAIPLGCGVLTLRLIVDAVVPGAPRRGPNQTIPTGGE
ncbi:TRAP transporter small permease [Psychromarinibacter sp. C21-152]|uniref:TRAP transporter small permease protein n=1 Tax=Psychromarinibacter sediminicola TaxID=3033385 RepID=A0AAE3T756_9RHOB|nr:TRAP transporter small permease [Psychromarinibacter sediminicola]MDF0599273.1 TRAP transporter small permease [Psychromarinibacter sediminicola]